jgi:hypothetical protein
MGEALSITLEADERATLAPDSARFKGVYQQLQPRSADQVRELLGFSDTAAEALTRSQARFSPLRLPSAIAAPENLESKDLATRAQARSVTHEAFRAFVHGGNVDALIHMKPAFDRYLELNKAVINIATLLDIEVANGATLTISASTHVVKARKIIIHPTGRIVCNGSTTFKIVSLEGLGTKPVVTGPRATGVRTLRQ